MSVMIAHFQLNVNNSTGYSSEVLASSWVRTVGAYLDASKIADVHISNTNYV